MTAGIRAIENLGAVPAPDGIYSLGIRFGNLLFLAGQGPFDANGNRVGTTVAEQIDKTLDNLEALANGAGFSLDHVVKFGVYLNTMDDVDVLNDRFEARLSRPYPARTTIVTSLLGFDVEIDAIIGMSVTP